MSALRWRLMRYGHDVAHGYAVNDVVLSHGALARLVLADIFIDGEFMGTVRADGFLLSTPMGSSGYSVSAGGPLLSPAAVGVADRSKQRKRVFRSGWRSQTSGW